MKIQGDGIVHVSAFDAVVEVNDPLPQNKPPPPDEVQTAIGQHVASLDENGKWNLW